MKILISLLILTICSCTTLFAQMKSTRLSGCEPDYANYQIDLYRPVDPFNLLPQKLGTIKINQLGQFETDIVLTNTTYVYADFDRWHTSTIFVPGKSYHLQFPPHKPLAEAEKRNPYFSSENVPLGLKALSKVDINWQIQDFEIAFSAIEDKYFDDLFMRKSRAALQNFKAEVLGQYPASSYTFFGQYIYYRLASVEYKLHMMDDNEFAQQYMNVESLPFNNPAFNNLYNEVFTNYFYTETELNNNHELRQAILSGKLSQLENYLYNQLNWGDDLRRITIIDAINDAFYLNLYHKDLLFSFLKQIQSSNWSEKFKKLAHKLYQRLTYLAVDTQAPNIKLEGVHGEHLTLNDTISREKINFLHFSNTNNPICRSHLDQIAQQYEKYNSHVQFIVIMPESCKAKLDAKTLNTWKGAFFFTSENNLKDYNIIAFPYSFLLSKDGKFLISPAQNPLEGMVNQLNRTIFEQRRAAASRQ